MYDYSSQVPLGRLCPLAAAGAVLLIVGWAL